LATVSLISPASVKQGKTIPGVAHLLCLESTTLRPTQSPTQ